jgi:ferritin-like protein
MASSSAGFHESEQDLTLETRDMHRAVVSLMEELEAVDWYQQRVDATPDPELRAILAHNRDEEKEHAAMILEWIRRRDAGFDAQLRAYLFTEGAITEREGKVRNGHEAAGASRPMGTVGALKGGR